jgi:hypothetical protein
VAVTVGGETVAVRQLGGAEDRDADIHVIVAGTATGLRIAADETTHPVDDTLLACATPMTNGRET